MKKVLIFLPFVFTCTGIMDTPDHLTKRKNMVFTQIQARGVRDQRVLSAMEKIPREIFVSKALMQEAYDDHPIPIGYGQTISQPYIVAYMTEKLRLTGSEKILEIGTGCGYQTSILAELSAKVTTVEIVPELCIQSKKNLEIFNFKNISYHCGDGSVGISSEAPYDRILGAAFIKEIPEVLIQQLKDGGLLVIPVGDDQYQELITYEKIAGKLVIKDSMPVRFVPMIQKDRQNIRVDVP